MATYHLYYLRQGMLIGSSNVEAPDDDSACRLAGASEGGEIVEVWNSHRRIRILPAARPSTAAAERR